MKDELKELLDLYRCCPRCRVVFPMRHFRIFAVWQEVCRVCRGKDRAKAWRKREKRARRRREKVAVKVWSGWKGGG